MIKALLNTLSRIFGRGLFKYDRGYIFELDRETFERNRHRAVFPDSYESRPARSGEYAEVSRVADLPAEESNRRAKAGDICFGVFEGNRPANVNWVHPGGCYIRGAGYIHRADKSEHYIYGIVTDPSERGKGLYKNALYDLAEYLFHNGATKLIQMAQDGNAPVLHSLPKMGYKMSKEYIHYRILGIKYTLTRNLLKGTGDRDIFITPPNDLFVI